MDQTANANWESYWSDLPKESGQPLWDSAGAETARAQLPLFGPHFAEGLPLLDIGCGNGTQTAALAAHFPRVLGLDFAEAAIEHARVLQGGGPAEFRRFDLADLDGARSLRGELGDANAYMRGVLHQMPEERRPVAVAALSLLLGATGTVFALELKPSAGDAMRSAMASDPDAVPKVRRVFRHGIKPASWPEGALRSLLDDGGMVVVESGEVVLCGTDSLPDGSPLLLPMTYVVARNKT